MIRLRKLISKIGIKKSGFIDINQTFLYLDCYINWANQKADWYDPLIEREDPLLGPFKPELIETKEKDRLSYYPGYFY